MNQSGIVTKFMLFLLLAAITTLMFSGIATAADAISLPASEPYTMYYTTNGATPAAPTSSTSTTSATPVQEVISLVPNAGKGRSYKKPDKLKIHESKYEFEKHVKEKHGKRFKVMDFSARYTDSGLNGHIHIVENKDPSIIQLGDVCTEEELAKRIAIAKEFILNNQELIGLTENEELRGRGERNYCGSLYFDRYINGYKLLASGLRFGFVPQFNYSVGVNVDPITPEMYAMAQQKSLTEEEVADIVYKDLVVAPSKKDKTDNSTQQLPKLEMRKYLRNTEPYAIWEVRSRYVYEINAVTGEIVRKYLNRK